MQHNKEAAPQKSRRNFIKNAGLLAAGMATGFHGKGWGVLAPAAAYPRHNIPAIKNIDPAWIQSLRQRGMATAYTKTKNELKYIGMPAGGLHAGTVYVGGDGRLWLWQIYNRTIEPGYEGIEPKTVKWNDGTAERSIRSRDGAAYIEPALAANHRLLDQGFAIKISVAGKTIVKELNEDHWDEVVFRPCYPIAFVEFSSRSVPVTVGLQVYAPFIPLDAAGSSLPATIMRVSIKNTGNAAAAVSLLGWMENGAQKISAVQGSGKRVNKVLPGTGYSSIFSTFETPDPALQQATDSGNMCFTFHGAAGKAMAGIPAWLPVAEYFNLPEAMAADMDAPEKLVGGIAVSAQLAPGKTLQADYSVCWYFNNPNSGLKKLVKDAAEGYWYGAKYKDALEVSNHLSKNFTALSSQTEAWVATWNDASLPHWLLERSFVNIATLATANTYRFADGRFWSWEGVGACAGTCTHVWQYAQAVARIFPELERDLRQRVDLGIGFKEDSGAVLFRGENETRPAIDGQAGVILRCYREHQMSSDDSFLRACWPRIKKAALFMMQQDKNNDGMTDTPMENTLDAVWEGEIAWIVGLTIAAASAAQQMAVEMRDEAFAATCSSYVKKGSSNMELQLFNGEYFIHRPDAVIGRKPLGSYNTCHIDQVYGQSWAFQVGLPRIISREKSLLALKALWKYNFTMDVGPYIKTHTGGRPYALPGEGGMIMNTNPLNEPRPYGENTSWQLGYFHECMTGFEHQVAAHLMAEGLVDESLVLTRVIHDRYHAAKRNPFNEIECSDHYARAMASYGTFISACGFRYHGPAGIIGFSPRLQKEKFRAPFTTAKGWGTYSQEKQGNTQVHRLLLKYGVLLLKELNFESMLKHELSRVAVKKGSSTIAVRLQKDGSRLTVYCNTEISIAANEQLDIVFS